jgi:ribosomal protein L11 methyltransferase
MKGARPLDAIDIDPWCYENSIENAQRNQCQYISVYEGDASLLKGKEYDVIIANINRNILLKDMKTYTQCLLPKGTLLLSGFYQEDIDLIDPAVTQYGLKFDKKIVRNNWVALRYIK